MRIACETRFSTTSLEAMIPDWLPRGLVTSQVYLEGPPLPDGAAAAIAAAAEQWVASVRTPATHDQRTAVLGDLRLMTVTRDENREEARARFRKLREHVADVPIEVLVEACERYARENKFFPVVAELVSYTAAIMGQRARMAHRLKRIADDAARAEAERKRLAEDPLTPEAAEAIMAEFGIRRSALPEEIRHLADGGAAPE